MAPLRFRSRVATSCLMSLVWAASATHGLVEPVIVVAGDTVKAQQGSVITPEIGLFLAAVGGSLYAVAAFLTSYASKAIRDGWPGWDAKKKMRFEILSGVVLAAGGGGVTVAYMSGYALALLNAIAYGCQLMLNMLFQMKFSVTEYTKTMMAGTTMFAIATIQLSYLAPAPKDITPDQLLTVPAIVFQVCFWIIVGSAGIGLRAVSNRSIRDTTKIFSWAICVTGFGVLTDNWARVMGVLDGWAFYAVAAGLVFPGVALGYMYIRAMSSCDVAIYVPTQLCLQLVANLIGGYCLWGDGEGLEYPLPYIMGYVMIVFSVYVASPELDVMAMYLMVQERKNAGLSKGEAKTTFGLSILDLVESWNQLRHPYQSSEAGDLLDNAKDSLRQVLLVGAQSGNIKQDDLVDLSVHLWTYALNTASGANAIIEWFDKTPYFAEYMTKDPKFRAVLIGSLPVELRQMAGEKLNLPEVMMMNITSEIEVARFMSAPTATKSAGGALRLQDRMHTLELSDTRRKSQKSIHQDIPEDDVV